MERKALFIGLLQSLSFFASAYSDSNGTSMDRCIDADMKKIMEYTETLKYSSANDAVITNDEGDNLLPFGALKTDWKRLHLLHEALPSDSVLKPKFKHLLRLLLIAHEETNRFVASSQSTKSQDKIESKTTVSITIKVDGNIKEIDKERPITKYETIMNSTDRSQQIGKKFQEFSSTISLISPKYDKDNVDTVMAKNSSQLTIVHDNEDETKVKSNIPETISTIGSPMIIVTSKPILEISNTDIHHDDLSVNKTPVLTTEKPSIFSAFDEAISNDKKNSTMTPVSAMSSVTGDYSPITVAFSSLSDNKKNLTSTEIFVKQEIENFSSTSSTSIGMNTKMEKNKVNDTLSYQASPTNILTAETSANENFLPTTILNFVLTKNPLDSTSRKNVTISTKSMESSSPKILAITRPAERKWSYGNPSSTTVSSPDTTKVLFSSSTQREAKPLASTIEKNLTVVPVTTSSSVLRNINTDRIKNEESSLSDSLVQSTRKVERASERSASPIGKYSSTLRSTNVYTDAIIQSITDSIEKAPIASVQDNEEASLDYGKKFATSEKSTERNHEISNSTSGLIHTSGNSTAIMVKETNGSINKQQPINNIDKSKFEPITEMINYTRENMRSSTIKLNFVFDDSTISTSTKNYSDEPPTPAIVIKETNLPSYNGINRTAGLISVFISSTFPTTVTNSTEESLTTVIMKKETNLPREKPAINKTEKLEDKLVTENINYSITSDTYTTSEENKNISKTKLIYVKNYLHADTPSGNNISRDFKHEFENVDGDKKKSESQEIILFESGGGAITGNTWRPHILWKQPVENNIRRYDKYPKPLGRYGYQRLPSMKPDIDVGSGRSIKWPFVNRTNLLRTGKRDSVNADIEKQFRSYYREGKIDHSKKSRIDENHNSKILIQCKNV